MTHADHLIPTSQAAVRIAIVLNRLFLAACLLGLAASWIFPGFFHLWLSRSTPPADITHQLAGMRQQVVTGMVMAVLSDRLLVTLAAIVATVGAGDPFIPTNALRLRALGWYLVALQLADIPAALLATLVPAMGNTGPAFNISIKGWLAILMVFVLSRVFASGSAMRDDLQGTV